MDHQREITTLNRKMQEAPKQFGCLDDELIYTHFFGIQVNPFNYFFFYLIEKGS